MSYKIFQLAFNKHFSTHFLCDFKKYTINQIEFIYVDIVTCSYIYFII